MSNLENLIDQIANHLLTHVGGDESDPWQAGHNYAMTEAARLVREQWNWRVNAGHDGQDPIRDDVYVLVRDAVAAWLPTRAHGFFSVEDFDVIAGTIVVELFGSDGRG